jgi:hypothetical protein
MAQPELPRWLVTVGNGTASDGQRVLTVEAPDAISAIVCARQAAVRTGWAPLYQYAHVTALEMTR